MKHLFFYCFLLVFSANAFGQQIPQSKLVNWQLAGNTKPQQIPGKFVNFQQAGGIANGIDANDKVIKRILDSLKKDTALIYFPNGKYFFTESVKIAGNITLKGQSADSALLLFKLKKQDHLIKVEGSISQTEAFLQEDIYKDSDRIVTANANLFSAGDYIKIVEDDADLVASSWAKGYTGQIIRIEKISGSAIYLSSPLRRSFHISKGVKIVKVNLAQNVGIETIKIERQDVTADQTSNIIFKYAANCYVKCIESYNCNYAHIEINSSTNIQVTGSYLHHAFNYGDGGKGYGVLVHLTSGECLIKDNIFNNLRHSMLLQAGANGNVLAYNYSINPIWTDVMLPGNAAGDIVLHGNYVYANLFEGNVVQNIVIDNSHGKNGPGNTFFRNRAELYGVVMNNNAGDEQVFIGNEITNKGFLMGNFSLTGKDNYEYANNKNGKSVSGGTQDLSERSLFLDEAPAFYKTKAAWPPIGFPNTLNNNNIEAQDLYKKGILTPCAYNIIPKDTSATGKDTSIIIQDSTTILKDTTVIVKDTSTIITDTTITNTDTTSTIDSTKATGIFLDKASTHHIQVYPNPAKDIVFVSAEDRSTIHEIKVFSTTGQQISDAHNISKIDVSGLKDGIYFLSIHFADNKTQSYKILKQK
jgi:hypothetical protein